MTSDERRAIAFVALLLVLAAGARLVRRDPPVEWVGEVDADSLAAEARARIEEAERRARPLAPGERIDPNTASDEELDRLPGVGPSLARRIVAAREEGGRFRSLHDLTRVRGIGPSALKRLAPHLDLPPGPASTPNPIEPFGSAAMTGPAGNGSVAPPGAGGRMGSAPNRPRTPRTARNTPTARAASTASTARTPLDLNRATASELEALPGIGPALAARIVAYRDSVGGFRDIAELARVRGIGAATLERLRPLVEVRP